MKIPWMDLRGNARAPSKAFPDDAGYDLTATAWQVISPGELAKVHTGIAMKIPKGFAGVIKDRSGLGSRGLNVHGGLIDPGYQGEIVVLLMNHSSKPITLEAGSRVAQMVIVESPQVEFEQVNSFLGEDSMRGVAGFGSTGK